MGDGSLITGFYAWGSDIGTILQDWEYMGVFEYVLPFLLVFAVVFGILHKSNVIGDHKGINLVVSLSIGLLAITSYTFRTFFRDLFPMAGIGIAILLVGLILTGLFYNERDNWWRTTFFVIAMLIGVIIVFSALTSYSQWGMGSWWWREYLNSIIVGAVVIGLMVLVVFATNNSGGGGGRTR